MTHNPFYRTERKQIYIPSRSGRLGRGTWIDEPDPFGRLLEPSVDGEHLDIRDPFALSGPVGRRGGNVREDVGKIECLLRLAGVHDLDPTDGPTGYFGTRLEEAVKAFQKGHGLRIDGEITPGGETLKALAQTLQSMGRHGDTVLAHLTPGEAQFLHEITDGGTLNPMPEFFLGDFFTGLSNGFSGIGESFMSGLSSFSDGLSGLGDNIGDGIKNLFGDNGLSDSTVKATDSAAATKLERPNLLEDTLKPAEPVFRNKLLRPEETGGPRFATPPEPKPVRTISAHNAFGAGRTDRGFAKGTARPSRANLLADPPAVAAPKTMAPPTLSNESLSSNRRLAESLAKTSDFTGIKRHIKPGLEKADPLAVAETHDLINQMNEVSKGHGDKLAKELGLAMPKADLPFGAEGGQVLTDGSGQIDLGGFESLAGGVGNSDGTKQPSKALMEAKPKTKPIPPGEDKPGEGYRSSIHEDFRKQLAGKESGRDGYQAFNPSAGGIGALGKYQLRKGALVDAGYYDQDTKRWTGKGGIKSAEDFLNNPQAQERAFVEAMQAKQKYLKKLGVLKTQGQVFRGVKGTDVKITESGLIAAAHREGQGRVRDYINHIREHKWKSDASTFPKGMKDKYLKVETRLRQFQNTRLSPNHMR